MWWAIFFINGSSVDNGNAEKFNENTKKIYQHFTLDYHTPLPEKQFHYQNTHSEFKSTKCLYGIRLMLFNISIFIILSGVVYDNRILTLISEKSYQ